MLIISKPHSCFDIILLTPELCCHWLFFLIVWWSQRPTHYPCQNNKSHFSPFFCSYHPIKPIMCCNKMFSTNWACSFDNSALSPPISCKIHVLGSYMIYVNKCPQGFHKALMTSLWLVLFKHQPFLLLYVWSWVNVCKTQCSPCSNRLTVVFTYKYSLWMERGAGNEKVRFFSVHSLTSWIRITSLWPWWQMPQFTSTFI